MKRLLRFGSSKCNISFIVGFGLYKLFEYQGINKDTTSRKIVNYDIKDYVETVPVVLMVIAMYIVRLMYLELI